MTEGEKKKMLSLCVECARKVVQIAEPENNSEILFHYLGRQMLREITDQMISIHDEVVEEYLKAKDNGQ